MEDDYSKKISSNNSNPVQAVPQTNFYRYFIIPSLVVSGLFLIATIIVSFIALCKNKFANSESISWIFNLVLNCLISLILAITIVKAQRRLLLFQQSLVNTFGHNQIYETDFVYIRSRQLSVFAGCFIGLTVFEVFLIIFSAIVEANHEGSNINVCFSGCAVPTQQRGAAYLSIKFLFDLFCPQVYLLVFWYIPKRLFVSGFRKVSLVNVVLDDRKQSYVDCDMLLEDKIETLQGVRVSG